MVRLRIRKKLSGAALLVLMLCVAPAVAQGHTLSVTRAGEVADSQAYDFADYGEYYGSTYCQKRSAHVRRCIIWSYDEEEDTTCDAYVNVRMSPSSYRLRAGRWYAIDCFGGDEYGALEDH